MLAALALFGHAPVYLAGDTIWQEDVAAALDAHRPDVAILNTGYAMVRQARQSGAEPEGTFIPAPEAVNIHRPAPAAAVAARLS